MLRSALSPIAVALAFGCARPATTPAPAAAPPRADTVAAVRWTRASAEHRGLFLQSYRLATEIIEKRAAGAAPGSWAVILDADETTLDNSVYQQERASAGLGYSRDSWNAWVNRGAAAALPGAAAFTHRVHELGGRVVIVTNRDDAVCAITRDNLRRVNVEADQVLCAPPGVSDKNPRFATVQAGGKVLMWVGDNIEDFPTLHQTILTERDAAFDEFGRAYILLPNPMYGSWGRAPLP